MDTKIKHIADLKIGYHTQPAEHGDVRYLLTKNFDEEGNLENDLNSFVSPEDTNMLHLLKDGDVLFAAKGNRNFAWTYVSSIGPAIASSIFIILRPNKQKVLPEYISTIFNLPQLQEKFQVLGAGSSIPSIRKSELEAFKIPVPSIDIQKKIVKLKELHITNIHISKKVIEEKQNLYNSVINTLIFKNHG
ncbi:MAG: restriction endonuclease subunit S [Cyclobacteriaceae bacterium]|nr:restriction endonuclease subunit S [Cyclobacteriaceae bacterium]